VCRGDESPEAHRERLFTSLLSLQSRGAPPEARAALAECRNRGHAMALTHQLLHENTDVARLHVGQFEDVGGAEFAAEIGAASADHLEHVSEGGLRAMAAAGVVGVLLPTAAFTLGQAMPDARRMRALGVEVAVATDCNPGTSHNESLPLAVSFAVRQMGLTTVEAWWAVTRAAARSLGQTRGGTITRGGPMALSIFDLPSWQALPAHLGRPLVHTSRLA
jgi:imidazolonepropionase